MDYSEDFSFFSKIFKMNKNRKGAYKSIFEHSPNSHNGHGLERKIKFRIFVFSFCISLENKYRQRGQPNGAALTHFEFKSDRIFCGTLLISIEHAISA